MSVYRKEKAEYLQKSMYDPVLAFSRGTIFPALDKPFLGEEAVPQ